MKKICITCKIEKDIDLFSIRKRGSRTGFFNQCKKCIKEARKVPEQIIISVKTCTICNKEKELELFAKNKFSKDGRYNQCGECINTRNKIYYAKNAKKYYNSQREKLKLWAETDPKKLEAWNKRSTKQKKEWIERNPNYVNEWHTNRRKTDILYRLHGSIRASITNALKKDNTKKKSRTVDILGCSIEDFKKYIEKQFDSWMNWDNYGKYNPKKERTWQLDHKIPISSALNESDIIKLNHYTNFRPLDSLENILKRDKFIF
jgi:bacterioferritin-associated ferredoxin